MTLANLVSTGSGRLGARWEIEGIAIQFCTELGMEQTLADGRRRLCVTSLDECGFSIDESVNIPEALLEAKSTSLTLRETVDEDLAGIFHHRADVERWGPTGITDAGTTLTLHTTDGITEGDVLHLGTEAIKVDTGGVAATTLTLSNRAYWGTVAQYHYSSDTPTHPDLFVTNRPMRVRGRQVRLWLYGDGDDLQGEGYLRWIGIVNSEPVLTGSGTTYRLSFGPITDRLKTKIGGDLDTPIAPRGIYYPATAALRIQILEYSPSALSPSGLFTGFYETQVQFTDALTAWLAAFVSDEGLDSAYRAEPTPDGRWTIRCTVGASTTSVAIQLNSEQDGASSPRADEMRYDAPDGLPVGSGAVSSGDVIYVAIIWHSLDGHSGGTVPRGFWGTSPSSISLVDSSAAATSPQDRVYTSRPPDASWSSVAADWPGASDGKVHSIISIDASDGWMQLNRAPRTFGESTAAPGYLYTSSQNAAFQLLRTIATGDLSDFRDALIAEAVIYANLGTAPFLTSRDVMSWDAAVARAAFFPWQRRRFYAFASSVDFEEMLAQECRLLGLFPVTNTTGKIDLVGLALPTGSTPSVFDIDEEIATVDGQAVELSDMVRGNQTVNRVHLKIGYDARKDSWSNWREVKDQTSFALDHQDRVLEIAPKSWAIGAAGDVVPVEELHEAVLPVMSLFGYPHEFVTVKVTWKAFDVRLGDAVTFSADHLPHYLLGERPISAVNAIVVGRKWPLGAVHGELTILLSWQNVAGYAPTARVSSQANTAGDTWDLTVSTALYFASGQDPTDHFAVDDEVRIVQVDSESATVVTGTVTAVSATVIQVDFDATWTPGSDTWDLQFATYTLATNPGQTDYAFFAGTDLVLGSGDAPRTLGP